MKIKYYCGYCGDECDIESRLLRFDNRTGKEVVSYRATCPAIKKAGWLERLFTQHAKNEFAGGEEIVSDFPDY